MPSWLVKTEVTFGRIREQISENPGWSLGFSPGNEGTDNIFYFFYEIIFFRLKEKDDMRNAYVYFNFFHDTVNSHNLETANHIARLIFVFHSAMKT